MSTLKELFLNELADIHDAEKRIAKALPKLVKATTCPTLKEALESHLQETEGHITKVEKIFACFEEKPRSQKCEATVGLLEEGDGVIAEFKDSPALNAAIVSAAQKVEHYEMASYGCLYEWATLLGNEEASSLLQEILEEEKAANETLTDIAREECNVEALGSEEEPDETAGDDEEGQPSRRRSSKSRPR